MYYLETNSTDPCFNLAFEEYFLTRKKTGDYLILWQNAPSVIVGLNQCTEAEIDQEYISAHQISVIRRTTGGGAVYHDLGNLNYSFITDRLKDAEESASRFTEPVVRALKKTGIDAHVSGRNDILAGGKKISGMAQRYLGERILHHGTLLFDADLDVMARALHANPIKFRTKGISSVSSRVGNIRPLLHGDMDLWAFWTFLKSELMRNGCGQIEISPGELAEIRQLAEEKYCTWEWNYGKSPKMDISRMRCWKGGVLEVRVQADHGRISDIIFLGDYMGGKPADPIRDALRGCVFRPGPAAQILQGFALQEYFGQISLDEILQTIFETYTAQM